MTPMPYPDLPLPEQLVVERPRRAFGFQPELLVKQAPQLLVALADGVAQADAACIASRHSPRCRHRAQGQRFGSGLRDSQPAGSCRASTG
jgi:hypothetical protein